jgi:hypothetical protein
VGPHYDSADVHGVCIEASTEDLYFGILKFGTGSSLAVGYTFPQLRWQAPYLSERKQQHRLG